MAARESSNLQSQWRADLNRARRSARLENMDQLREEMSGSTGAQFNDASYDAMADQVRGAVRGSGLGLGDLSLGDLNIRPGSKGGRRSKGGQGRAQVHGGGAGAGADLSGEPLFGGQETG